MTVDGRRPPSRWSWSSALGAWRMVSRSSTLALSLRLGAMVAWRDDRLGRAEPRSRLAPRARPGTPPSGASGRRPPPDHLGPRDRSARRVRHATGRGALAPPRDLQ